MEILISIANTLSDQEIVQLTENLESAVARHEYFHIKQKNIRPYYDHIRKLLSSKQALIVLAKSGNSIIGSMVARFSRIPTQTRIARFQKLTVNPEFRGQHLGTKLFEALENAVKNQGKSKIIFHCHRDNPARKLYRNIGYRETWKTPILKLITLEKHI